MQNKKCVSYVLYRKYHYTTDLSQGPRVKEGSVDQTVSQEHQESKDREVRLERTAGLESAGRRDLQDPRESADATVKLERAACLDLQDFKVPRGLAVDTD